MTWRWRTAAWSASAAIVLGSPLVGDLRQALLRTFPKYYVAIIAGGVGLGAILVLGMCARRIRDDRAQRLGALAAAVALALVAFAGLRSGNPNVDAVEAFHFIEYSVLALLFFPFGDVRARWQPYVQSALACTVVATADEWFQWFVPARAGELHDVLFDLVAIACGLLLCFGVRGRRRESLDPPQWRSLGLGTAVVIVFLAGFVATVQLGTEIRDPQIGTFRSRFTGARLLELGEERRRAWVGGPPPAVGQYGREDQYLAEALWHVRRRNFGMDKDRHGDAHELDVAWHENRILQAYFAPVLEAPPAPGTTGHRLAPEQIADVDARRAHGTEPFVSDAEAAPIFIWPSVLYWTIVLLVAAVVIVTGWLIDRSRRPRGRPHRKVRTHA